METRRRGHRRALPWQPAPTIDDILDRSVSYAKDVTMVNAGVFKSSLRPMTKKQDYLNPRRSPEEDDDEYGHDFRAGRRAWQAMLDGPRDAAVRKLQPLLRGRRVRSRLERLSRARSRWLNKRIAAAFGTWESWSRAVSIRSFGLRRVFLKLENWELARGLRRWVETAASMRDEEAVLKRVLNRMLRGKWLWAAWRSWLLAVDGHRRAEAAVVKVLRRLANRTLALAWKSWRLIVETARRALLRRVLSRLANQSLAGGWRAWRLALVAAKNRAALLALQKCGDSILRRWSNATLGRAWAQWRPQRRKLRLLTHAKQHRRQRPDENMNAHVATLETLLKQLRVMRLEEQLGDTRAASRTSGWITPLPLNHALPTPYQPRAPRPNPAPGATPPRPPPYHQGTPRR